MKSLFMMPYPFSATLRAIPRWFAAFCCLPALFASGVPLDEANRMLEEGVAEAAIVKYQQQIDSGMLDPMLLKQAKTRLSEALLLAGRREDALRQVNDPDVDAPLLKARILAAAGDWNAALAVYSGIRGNPQAIVGKAECLHALGRLDDAISALEKMIPKDPPDISLRLAEYYLDAKRHNDCLEVLGKLGNALTAGEHKRRQYLEARLLLLENKPAAAFDRFEALQRDPRDVSEEMMIGIILGMTEARTTLTGLTAADDILEMFIWKHPGTPYLNILFRKLDEVYSGEENPSVNELQKWSQRDPANRAGYAAYYLAKLLTQDQKQEAALAALENYSSRFHRHPMLPRALMLQGKLLADAGNFDAAQKALDEAMRVAPDELRAEVEMATGCVQFKAGQFVLAATVFRNAGEHNRALAESATYNAALSWLYQGNYERFGEIAKLLPNGSLRADLFLEEGALRARRSDPMAGEVLHRFIRDYPGNPRVPEAWLALAEICYMHNDSTGADQFLRVVNETPVPEKTSEQSDFLAIFVADSTKPPSDDKVIALCRTFIERHAGSLKIPEVRMKLGQVYFRSGDFANAQTQFETIKQESPASPLVEQALFLAGESSTKRIDTAGIDRAIELFGEVAARNGPLKFHARLQLALLQNRLGKEGDAVKLYDDILRANPSNEIKWTALAGKADNLFAMGAKDKTLYEQAYAFYEQLAREPGIDAAMRDRALYNKGRCLETLGRPEEALAAYYEVVESNAAKPQEYFWFYKAGFDACRLSESREQWKSAIVIYKKMAAIDGPRAEEAKANLSRLRLEHFIWE